MVDASKNISRITALGLALLIFPAPRVFAQSDPNVRMAYRVNAPEFATAKDPGHRLVLADEKGVELKTISGMSYTNQWSPDGELILLEFESQYDYGAHVLAVMGTDFKFRPVLGQGPDLGPEESESFSHPVWSADGKSIVAMAGFGEVVALGVNVESANTVCSEKRDDIQISGAFPSPDGGKFALIAYPKPYTTDSENDVFIAGVGCSNPVRLTTDAPRPSSIRWSPDGKRIAFLNSPHEIIENKIIVIDADGGNRHEFKEGYHHSVSWTADGRLLATWTDMSTPKDRMCFLGTIDPATGQAVVLKKEIDAYFNDAEWRP